MIRAHSTLVLVGIFLALIAGCDPGRPLIIRNESANDVIFVAASEPNRELTIASGREREFGVIQNRSFGTFKLAKASGEVLFEGDLQWEELERIDFRLVIDDAGVRDKG